jgi:dipeptidase E
MTTESEIKRVLLISSSKVYGSGYLDQSEGEIRDFLGSVRRVLFIPFALYDRDAYATMARGRFKTIGYELESIHTASNPQRAVSDAEAIFIGGGIPFGC